MGPPTKPGGAGSAGKGRAAERASRAVGAARDTELARTQSHHRHHLTDTKLYPLVSVVLLSMLVYWTDNVVI